MGVWVGIEVGLRSMTVGRAFAVVKGKPPALRAEVRRPVPTYFMRPMESSPSPAPCNTATGGGGGGCKSRGGEGGGERGGGVGWGGEGRRGGG